MDFLNHRDPSPAHPLRLDALGQVVCHAGEERTLLDWWTLAADDRVDDPAALADAVVEAVGVEALLMCIWHLRHGDTSRHRDAIGPARPGPASLTQRLLGRLARDRTEALSAVLDAWLVDGAAHLEDRQAIAAAEEVIMTAFSLPMFGEEPPLELEHLVLAVTDDRGAAGVGMRAAALAMRALHLLPAERARRLRARLPAAVVEQIEGWREEAATNPEARLRLATCRFDPDEIREEETTGTFRLGSLGSRRDES